MTPPSLSLTSSAAAGITWLSFESVYKFYNYICTLCTAIKEKRQCVSELVEEFPSKMQHIHKIDTYADNMNSSRKQQVQTTDRKPIAA